jgi:endonuclease/exonuclease/phosphatase family metal-dependent hydrolase
MNISKHKIGLILLPVVAMLLVWAAAFAGQANDKPVDTTVMSFNIRYAGAADGENSWDNRRYLVRRAIRDHKPAIFGVQECLWEQGTELNEAFYGYRITGVGRDDGVRAGEMCLIFTRQDRYHVLDQGFFWLSEKPETPGSKGWDAACPRIVTWVKLRDRWCNPDTLFVVNTHFDHVGAQARIEGARLLQKRVADLAGGYPVILMGDFNDSADSDSPAFRLLAEEGYKAGLALRDTWFFAGKEERMKGEGTFHGFSGEASRGRIDWILTSGEFPGVGAGIERFHKNGRYPSDHFPVWATFRQERHPPMPGDEIDSSTGATPRY